MTRSSSAISSTANVSRWLADSDSARLLHVFDHACNLTNENKEVLSIVTPQIGNGPFNLVIENDINFREYLSLESPVSHTATQLQLGDLTIQTQHAKIWDPCPDWNTFRAKVGTILRRIKQFSTTESLFSSLQFSNSLPSALAAADFSSSIKAAQTLAGLGQGLTPSGDDFMMGAIYAAWIIHSRDVAETLAAEIANTAAPLTTSLSAAWLRAAAKGEAGILWHRFLDALTCGDSSAIELEKSNILSIGATSGADALAGFIHTFIAYMEIEKKHVLP